MNTKAVTTWRTMKLGELSLPRGSVSGPFGSSIKSEFFRPYGVPVIRGNNLTLRIEGGRFIDSGYIFLDEKKADELAKAEALAGDLILTARGTIGQTGLVPKDAKYPRYIISANQLRFRLDPEKADPEFVYYQLSSPRMVRHVQGNSVNVGVPNFNLGAARNIEIQLPEDVFEQKRIASILSAFDQKIDNNNRIIKALEEMAQIIFKERFVKNSKNKKLERVSLGKVVELIYGKALKGENRENGDVLVVGSSGIVGRHNESIAKGPGIVVGRKGVAGSVIWVDEDFYPIDTTFYVKTELPLIFCYYLLRGANFISGDSAVPGLNREDAYRTEVQIPDQTAMEEFQRLVEPMFLQRYVLHKENQKLIIMRNLLLSRLMSGKIII